MFRLIVLVLLAALLQKGQSSDDNLKSVIVLYHHGDRAPIRSYKNDPYNESYWQFGFGQLTNIGKNQHYELGQWLRLRYMNFLPRHYNKLDIKVLSSNSDRCLMSAASNLAGLYPPVDDEIWNTNLNWQPIPIHTTPENEDAILAQDEPCPKYKELYKKLMETAEFKHIICDNENLFEYLSQYSGESITTLEDLHGLYNILFVEDLYNFTLPDWTKKVYPEGLNFKNLSELTWRTYTYTPTLAKLKAGPLIDLITTHFENIAYNTIGFPKFLMLSAHDCTIVSLLNALGIFDMQTPPYASTVILELRKDKENHFVNIIYKKAGTVSNLTLPDCEFNCGLDDFMRIVRPLRINSEERRRECQEVLI